MRIATLPSARATNQVPVGVSTMTLVELHTPLPPSDKAQTPALGAIQPIAGHTMPTTELQPAWIHLALMSFKVKASFT
jgi:hypothetical protein